VNRKHTGILSQQPGGAGNPTPLIHHSSNWAGPHSVFRQDSKHSNFSDCRQFTMISVISFEHLSLSVQTAITKYHSWVTYKQWKFISHSLESLKSKIEAGESLHSYRCSSSHSSFLWQKANRSLPVFFYKELTLLWRFHSHEQIAIQRLHS
jgi:hypothetical protein